MSQKEPKITPTVAQAVAWAEVLASTSFPFSGALPQGFKP